jgi:hypothetical protein
MSRRSPGQSTNRRPTLGQLSAGCLRFSVLSEQSIQLVMFHGPDLYFTFNCSLDQNENSPVEASLQKIPKYSRRYGYY